MSSCRALAVASCMLLVGASLSSSAITIETVPVGDSGTHGKLSGDPGSLSRVCGAVNYTYNIGKYEVTAGQYTASSSTPWARTDTYGLYNSNMVGNDSGSWQITRHGTCGNYTYTSADDRVAPRRTGPTVR